jgi:hypothetical protein
VTEISKELLGGWHFEEKNSNNVMEILQELVDGNFEVHRRRIRTM